MLDNPFSFIGDFYRTGKLEKWWRLAATCLIGAFVGFWGTLGTAGWALLAAGNSPVFALVGGFFSASTMMATVVYLSVRRSGLVKDLTLPKELENIVANSDIAQTDNRLIRDSADPAVRKMIE